MQFEYTGNQTDFERFLGGYRHINAFGPIARGDADKLLKLLETAEVPPATTVYIDSTGGDVEEGIKLGKLLRTHSLESSIGTYVLDSLESRKLIAGRRLRIGKCFSAATLMYAGGRLRHFPQGSKFGVHRFTFKNPDPINIERSQQLSAGIANFFQTMGIGLGFLSISADIASDQILELSESDLRAHNMVTGAETEVTWGSEIRADFIYVRGTRDSIFGLHKVLLGFNPSAGFIFSAIIEAQGRGDELCHFPLVEIVVNGEEHKIDISERCSRIKSGGDVVLLSKISQEEAKTLAYSESFGVQIKFSRDASNFTGVRAMETAGGQDSLQSFFNVLTAFQP